MGNTGTTLTEQVAGQLAELGWDVLSFSGDRMQATLFNGQAYLDIQVTDADNDDDEAGAVRVSVADAEGVRISWDDETDAEYLSTDADGGEGFRVSWGNERQAPGSRPLRTYVVDSPLGGRRWQAEDAEHAREQHAEAFPDEPILGVWSPAGEDES